MKNADRLNRLATLSELVLNARAQSLGLARAKRQRLEDNLAALDATDTPVTAEEMQRRLFYEGWAAPRRTTLRGAIQAAAQKEAAEQTQTQRAFARLRLLEELRDQTRANAAQKEKRLTEEPDS